MVIGEFLCWSERAKTEDRKSAAAIIARAACDPDAPAEDRNAAEAALTLLMDDPSPAVRRALAEQLSLLARAPSHIIAELAREAHGVSAPILARCALPDALLRQRVQDGCSKIQLLIANRPRVSATVADMIAQEGCLEAALLLVANGGAILTPLALDHLISRFGAVPEMRGALASDERLSLVQRQHLVEKTADALSASSFIRSVLGERRATRMVETAKSVAPLSIADSGDAGEVGRFAASLREEGRMTTALVLRALVFGRIDFFAAMICDLTARDARQVQSVLVNGTANSLDALFAQAGFGTVVRKISVEGVLGWRAIASGRAKTGPLHLSETLCAIAEGSTGHAADNDDLPGLMRTIHGELARASARGQAEAMIEREIERVREEDRIGRSCVAVLEDADLIAPEDIMALVEVPALDIDLEAEALLDDLGMVAIDDDIDKNLLSELDDAFADEFAFILAKEERVAA